MFVVRVHAGEPTTTNSRIVKIDGHKLNAELDPIRGILNINSEKTVFGKTKIVNGKTMVSPDTVARLLLGRYGPGMEQRVSGIMAKNPDR
jgi:hypothetical protein